MVKENLNEITGGLRGLHDRLLQIHESWNQTKPTLIKKFLKQFGGRLANAKPGGYNRISEVVSKHENSRGCLRNCQVITKYWVRLCRLSLKG